jgi:hypothetical protein
MITDEQSSNEFNPRRRSVSRRTLLLKTAAGTLGCATLVSLSAASAERKPNVRQANVTT